MSINQIMNISREAMSNNQYAMTVVSHNIANVNTQGYSKQRVEFTESILGNRTGMVKNLNGSTINSITSYASNTMNSSFIKSNTDANYLNSLTGIVKSMEKIATEMGETGLQKSISDFFASAQALNLRPTDATARDSYIQNAQNVITKFNSISKGIESTKSDLIGNPADIKSMNSSELGMGLKDINQKLERIAELNLEISRDPFSSQGGSNGLIDQRNMLLDEISSYIPIKVTTNPNSTVNVTLGDTELVKGGKVAGSLEISAGTADEPAIIKLVADGGHVLNPNLNKEIDSGSMGGILKMVGKSSESFMTLDGMMQTVNSMANDFAQAINGVQNYSNGDIRAMCLGKDPITGESILIEATEPFFTGGPPFTAQNLKVNSAILNNRDLIATARVDITKPDYEKNIGNTDNILAIYDLRDKPIMREVGSAVGSVTIEKFVSNLQGKVGLQSKDLTGKLDNQVLILKNVQTARQSAMGVNMDEELADMIKFQRSYEAAARMFSTANDILQILINLGR